MNAGDITGTLVMTLVIIVVLFLIFREVLCWYWKINQNHALLTEIRDLLKASLRTGTTSTPAAAATASPVATAVSAPVESAPPAITAHVGPMGSCPNCSTGIPLAAQECPNCKAFFGVGSAWKVQPH